MTLKACCRPEYRDDDRTHSINYSQRFYDGDPGDPPVQEEFGNLGVVCSHNDAIADAELFTSRFDVPWKRIGSGASWKGSDYERGYGTKVDIWISRGPGEEDYDAARQKEAS